MQSVVFHNHALALHLPKHGPTTHASKLNLLQEELDLVRDPTIKGAVTNMLKTDPYAAVVAYDALLYLSSKRKLDPVFLADHVLETLTSQPTLNKHEDVWVIGVKLLEKAQPRFRLPMNHIVMERAYESGAWIFVSIANPEKSSGNLDEILRRW